MSKQPPRGDPYDEDSLPTRLTTGVDGLDSILYGGLPADRVYLVEGDPGTGKTTLGLQFLLEGVRRGEPTLYLTLSETKEELLAVARSHGWSMDGIYIHELIPSEESLKPEEQYTIFHPSEVELSDTTEAVLEEVERIKPQRIVFDSLSEMRLLARDPLRYRRQILALKQYFIGRRCTVLLLDERTTDTNDRNAQSIAHGVIMLEHLAQEYGAVRRRLRVIKVRGSRFRGGYHDFKIETGGLVTFPRLIAAEHHREFVREVVSSGTPELDDLLGGGLNRGSSTLFMGPAGSGKSSLAAQFAVSAAEQGEHAAIYLFDEGIGIYLARAAGIGIDLRGHMEAGRIKVQQIDSSELTPGEFAHLVRSSVERDKARVVVIDSLNGYLNAMPEERFLSVQLHELLMYLNQQGIVTMLVMAQHGVFGMAMTSPVDVSYLTDAVLLLRYFEAEGAVRKALSVFKNRAGTHESTIREFQITPQGIRIGRALTEFQGVLTGVPTYTGKKEPLLREGDDEPRT